MLLRLFAGKLGWVLGGFLIQVLSVSRRLSFFCVWGGFDGLGVVVGGWWVFLNVSVFEFLGVVLLRRGIVLYD